nr:hypothetical protein [Streptomyces sp. DSM 41633]
MARVEETERKPLGQGLPGQPRVQTGQGMPALVQRAERTQAVRPPRRGEKSPPCAGTPSPRPETPGRLLIGVPGP